ncbi:uncharacterized protein M421DRAFT_57024 [Didymella exigua CBS 183.55]|uniref:Aminodeoxychorismate lyase n=1 Tax=Didymella exigua CBS 183.55 TaxID=1150837 RepID=A0A6A5S0Z7_9PLEO|nr:uncharacterized protein M421DRAFT_57024 [Didymella exigua CBS 183.55]KAF1931187.1 hypothetical protein M421DRAFT_57024 [Didymella exigua CBS 183.55]
MSSTPTFQLFTSIRYDHLLLTSKENSRPELNFITPSPFYMLTYHRDRMVEAAQHFDFSPVVAFLADGTALHRNLQQRVTEWRAKEEKQDGPLKVRISFDAEANMSVDFLPIPAVPLTTLYPASFDSPHAAPKVHPAQQQAKKPFSSSPLTGGALDLGPTDALPADLPAIPAPPEWNLRVDTHPTPSSPFTLLKTTERDVYDASRSRALPENPASPVHREVILYNTVHEVTEGTLTSLYFFRGGRWVTPPVGVPEAFKTGHSGRDESSRGEKHDDPQQKNDLRDEGELRKPFAGRWGHSVRSAKVGAGGQRGTSRRWALGKGYCMEEPIDVGTVEVGEGVWVSNGVRGFGWGRVVS